MNMNDISVNLQIYTNASLFQGRASAPADPVHSMGMPE